MEKLSNPECTGHHSGGEKVAHGDARRCAVDSWNRHLRNYLHMCVKKPAGQKKTHSRALKKIMPGAHTGGTVQPRNLGVLAVGKTQSSLDPDQVT